MFSDKNARKKYIRTTGLNEELATKSYCNMLDDHEARRRCIDKKDGFISNERLVWVLGVAMGDWSYNRLMAR